MLVNKDSTVEPQPQTALNTFIKRMQKRRQGTISSHELRWGREPLKGMIRGWVLYAWKTQE